MGLTTTISAVSPTVAASDFAAWNPANPLPTITTRGGEPRGPVAPSLGVMHAKSVP